MKCNILNKDFYNFDKTGFMIGIVFIAIVIINIKKIYNKSKSI